MSFWKNKIWSYYCPHCKEGFGNLEGKIIKRVYDGFGDQYTLLRCPRCGELVVTGPNGCEKYTPEDLEFFGLTTKEKKTRFKGSITLRKTAILNMLENQRFIFNSNASDGAKAISMGEIIAFKQLLEGDIDNYNWNAFMQEILWGETYGTLQLNHLFKIVFQVEEEEPEERDIKNNSKKKYLERLREIKRSFKESLIQFERLGVDAWKIKHVNWFFAVNYVDNKVDQIIRILSKIEEFIEMNEEADLIDE